ncbi:MAG: dephospho-CoA kinase, partial [Gammaproteobacteria bacterium]
MAGELKPRPLVIGLTGGIASGKSTAAEVFSELGVPVIDADTLTRELVEPGRPELEAIVNHFGEDVLDADGHLHRRDLRDRVFSDPNARRELEDILHPGVKRGMRDALAKIETPYCVLMIPLLVETGAWDFIDRVLVIDTEPSYQIRRTMERDHCDEDSVRSVLAAQASRETRLAAADDVIDNRGDPKALDTQVERLHQNYLELATS